MAETDPSPEYSRRSGTDRRQAPDPLESKGFHISWAAAAATAAVITVTGLLISSVVDHQVNEERQTAGIEQNRAAIQSINKTLHSVEDGMTASHQIISAQIQNLTTAFNEYRIAEAESEK